MNIKTLFFDISCRHEAHDWFSPKVYGDKTPYKIICFKNPNDDLGVFLDNGPSRPPLFRTLNSSRYYILVFLFIVDDKELYLRALFPQEYKMGGLPLEGFPEPITEHKPYFDVPKKYKICCSIEKIKCQHGFETSKPENEDLLSFFVSDNALYITWSNHKWISCIGLRGKFSMRSRRLPTRTNYRIIYVASSDNMDIIWIADESSQVYIVENHSGEIKYNTVYDCFNPIGGSDWNKEFGERILENNNFLNYQRSLRGEAHATFEGAIMTVHHKPFEEMGWDENHSNYFEKWRGVLCDWCAQEIGKKLPKEVALIIVRAI